MSAQNATRSIRLMNAAERADFFTEYERLVLRGAGVDVSSDKAFEIWKAVRRIPYRMERFDDVLPTMDLLKQQGLILGLISNMNSPASELVDNMGLSPYMDLAVTSGEVGVEKPHPPIFREALRRAGVEPAEAVHVGDQPASDIDGAAKVGIQPILIDRDGNHPHFTECPRIDTLMELPSLMSELLVNQPPSG